MSVEILNPLGITDHSKLKNLDFANAGHNDFASLNTPQTLQGVKTFSPTLNGSNGNESALIVTPTINQSGAAGYTGILLNVIENAVGSGSRKLLDLQRNGLSKFHIDDTGKIGIQLSSYGDLLELIGNGVTSLRIYQDSDPNWVRVYGNKYIQLVAGGAPFDFLTSGLSGYDKALQAWSELRSNHALTISSGADGDISINPGSGRGTIFNVVRSGTSGSESIIQINGNINQSGTASYTGLLLNVTETATGSGGGYLFRGQVGGADRFIISRTGRGTFTFSGDGGNGGDFMLANPVANDFYMYWKGAILLRTSGTSTVVFGMTRLQATAGSMLQIMGGAGSGDDISVNPQGANGTLILGASSTTETTHIVELAENMVVRSGKDVVFRDSANGIVLKDNAVTPHYWRVTVDSAGNLVTTDLGTTPPA